MECLGTFVDSLNCCGALWVCKRETSAQAFSQEDKNEICISICRKHLSKKIYMVADSVVDPDGF